ncbi:uncharacterized protein TNCV_4502191 [Trichonephila clavipes]|nr:uncharacterized protein TNCV_4502191 [Trichonephila clavipes]
MVTADLSYECITCRDLRMPDHRIFQRLYRQFRKIGSFHYTRHNAGRRRAVRDLMANVILFFWNRCYQNICRMFQSPFVTICGFSMMEHQPTSALMCVLTCMPRFRRGGLVLWPHRSPDLSSRDYFLWRHLKNLAYVTPIDSNEDFVARISGAAAREREIPGIFERVP